MNLAAHEIELFALYGHSKECNLISLWVVLHVSHTANSSFGAVESLYQWLIMERIKIYRMSIAHTFIETIATYLGWMEWNNRGAIHIRH